jgi:hypothetical protein
VSDDKITFELLALLVRNVQDEQRDFRTQLSEFRDQMTVQLGILRRVEVGLETVLQELRAVASQHQRTDRRLIALDERIRALEEERR